MAKQPIAYDVALSPLPENLLNDPLEYLRADHFRQETMRNLLTAAINKAIALDELHPVFAYMESELLEHLADEDEALFPLLHRAAEASPSLADVLAVLAEGHKRMSRTVGMLVNEMSAFRGNETRPGVAKLGYLVGAFCELSRWIVELEEHVIIPAARRHLDAQALGSVALSMAQRRHTHVPPSDQ